MLSFIGKTEVKADDKGRIFIPASYRKILAEMGEHQVVLRHADGNNCLIAFPTKVWDNHVAHFLDNLSEWDSADDTLLMKFSDAAEYADIDNQGRILLSKKNLASISASQDLVIVGMINRFAIWDRQEYENQLMPAEDFNARLKAKMVKKD